MIVGRIRLKNIRCRTIIGCMGVERVEKQDLLISIDLKYDSSKASISDNVEDSLNYKDLEGRVVTFVEAADYHILERLTRDLILFIMEDSMVKWCSVEVDKPKALKFCDSVSFELNSDDL
jgi:FolB domain-containing protein